MDFSLNPEETMIVQTVRDFVRRELLPLEPRVVEANLAEGFFPDDVMLRALQFKAKELGLWGIQTPARYGGADLGALMAALIGIECGRTFVPFDFGGWAPHILFECNEAQRERYLLPTIAGERKLAFALTEADAGSDASRIRTRAERRGGKWVLNGAKTWISGGCEADFAIVMAVAGGDAAPGGITAFLVDRSMGWTSRPLPIMSGEFRGATLNEPP